MRTVSLEKFRALNPCRSGYRIVLKAHKNKDSISIKDMATSNDYEDTAWFFQKVYPEAVSEFMLEYAALIKDVKGYPEDFSFLRALRRVLNGEFNDKEDFWRLLSYPQVSGNREGEGNKVKELLIKTASQYA